MKLHVKKGDMVQVIAGDDKGKIAKVLKVYPEKNRAIVEGVNVNKKHTNPMRRTRRAVLLSRKLPFTYPTLWLWLTRPLPRLVAVSTKRLAK